MPHKETNFGTYLSEIMEHGRFATQVEAAKEVGISTEQFSKIINGQRVTVSWDTGVKIVTAHISIMDRVVNATV